MLLWTVAEQFWYLSLPPVATSLNASTKEMHVYVVWHASVPPFRKSHADVRPAQVETLSKVGLRKVDISPVIWEFTWWGSVSSASHGLYGKSFLFGLTLPSIG